MKINYIDKYNESRVNSTSIVYETLKRYFEENKLLDNNSSISFGFFKNDLDIIEFTKNNSIDYVQRASFEHNIPTKKTLEVLSKIKHLFVLNSESLQKIEKMNASVLPHFLYIEDSLYNENKFEDFTVVNVSSPFMHKGTLESLNIFWKALGLYKDCKYICIGGDYNDYKSFMKRDQLENLKKISFFESLSNYETRKIIKKSHVFLSASMGEGCSLSQLESLYLGTPLLITDTDYHKNDQPWKNRALLIDSIKVPIKNFLYDSVIKQDSLRDVFSYEPSNVDGILKLKDLYLNYSKYSGLSAAHRDWMVDNWTANIVMNKYFWPHIK